MLEQPVAQSILSSLEASQPLEAASASSLRDAIETALDHSAERVLLDVRPERREDINRMTFDLIAPLESEGLGLEGAFIALDELVQGTLEQLIAVQNIGFNTRIGVALRGRVIVRAWEIPERRL